jgi:hypothetical protein
MRYSKVPRRTWAAGWFQQLSRPAPNAQSLWQYLATGPHLGVLPGLFAAGEAGLAEALGWPLEAFRSTWGELEGADVVHADWGARVVWLPSQLADNPPINPQSLLSWGDAWDELPECSLKATVWRAWREALAARGARWAEAFAKACVRPGAPLREVPPLPPTSPGLKKGKGKAAPSTTPADPGASTQAGAPDLAQGHAPDLAGIPGGVVDGVPARQVPANHAGVVDHDLPANHPSTPPAPTPPTTAATIPPPAPMVLDGLPTGTPASNQENQENQGNPAPCHAPDLAGVPGGVVDGVPAADLRSKEKEKEKDKEEREGASHAPLDDDAPDVYRVESVADLGAILKAKGITPTGTTRPTPPPAPRTSIEALSSRTSQVGQAKGPSPLAASSPQANEILTEMRRHEGLRRVATPRLADAIAASIVTGAVTIPAAKQAIAECALKHGDDDLSHDALAAKVKAFVAYAGRRSAQVTGGGFGPHEPPLPVYQTPEEVAEARWAQTPEGKAEGARNLKALQEAIGAPPATAPRRR